MSVPTLPLRATPRRLLAAALVSTTLLACADDSPEVADDPPAASVLHAEVSPDGPRLGVLAPQVPVLAEPSVSATQLGYLHSGAQVARSVEAVSHDGCAGGWYATYPRGFVCAGEDATTDLSEPTLASRALQPERAEPLPYTYARVRDKAALYARDPAREHAVQVVGQLKKRTALAVVGSWQAEGPEGNPLGLALLTDGRFVETTLLDAAEPSAFVGFELGADHALPVAFVVKEGVHAWHVAKGKADKLGPLAFHERLPLSGRYRTAGKVKAWAMEDGRYVRHQDVTVIRKREVFPAFATPGQKWVDVSIITGSMVLYEGHTPVYASLVSVGRDRLGDPTLHAVTRMGTFEVVAKHVTAVGLDPGVAAEYFAVHDLPWTLELSSGQHVHAALWHDRFGMESGPGSLQLSPADAAFVWHWAEPTLPPGWHGVTSQEGEPHVLFHIRK